MRSSPLLLTALSLLPHTLASTTAFPTLSLHSILYSTYWAFTPPSHLALNTGRINFTMTNSAVDDDIFCAGVNSNSWAVFYPSTVYECDVPDKKREEEVKRDVGMAGPYTPYCWINSASFTLDTTTYEIKNLSVAMSWTCEGEGVYGLTAWSVLNLDCEQWGCTNELWPVGGIFQKVTADCKPVDVTFLGDDVKVTKVQG